MKNINEFITEAVGSKITFKGTHYDFDAQEYELDHIIRNNDYHDKVYNANIDSINDLDTKDLLKQGCKYVLMIPPHTSNGNKVDYYIIKMFVKSKRLADKYTKSEAYALYDLKKQEFINKSTQDKFRKNDKTYRLD